MSKMSVNFLDVIAIAIHSKEGNKKNTETDKWEATGIFYHSLYVWKDDPRNPAAIQIRLKPEQIEIVKPALLKKCSLITDYYNSEKSGESFNFLSFITNPNK